MEKFLIEDISNNLGEQKIYRFDNDYGASVIRNIGSYGFSRKLWEIAVLFFDGKDVDITYNTPITDGVIGCLNWEDVENILSQIEKLEAQE